MLYDVIIVGGGPAGFTAALYCARAGFSTLLLEGLAPGGQMSTASHIQNYPGFENGIGGFDLAQKMQCGAEKAGAAIQFEAVLSFELAGPVKTVKAADHIYNARAVILAMGAEPRELGILREHELRGRGVSYCAACDAFFYKDRIAAVVGGGNSAVGEALELSPLCKTVYLIHRRDTLRADKSEQTALSAAKNIDCLWNTQVKALLGAAQLTGLVLSDTDTGVERTLSCDGLFIAIGRKPRTGILSGSLACDSQGYILAGENTETEISGVFAAGDVRAKPLRQIVTAAADGAAACAAVQRYFRTMLF